jgi:hypothetical protein
MCFSAEASFVASGVLAASSVATARIPKERSAVPLSLVPAIFATHQFAEGVLWLHHDGVLPDAYQVGALCLYAFIAYVLWPLYIPVAAYLLETGKWRRRVILVTLAAGLCPGLACLLGILRGPVTVAADCCHLTYYIDAPDLLTAPYLFAVSIPLLVSSRRGLRYFGLAVTGSCAAAALLASAPGFPSVWCFFAAVLSGGLYLYFHAEARTEERPVRASATSGAA